MMGSLTSCCEVLSDSHRGGRHPQPLSTPIDSTAIRAAAIAGRAAQLLSGEDAARSQQQAVVAMQSQRATTSCLLLVYAWW
jgi:hypothetical protein